MKRTLLLYEMYRYICEECFLSAQQVDCPGTRLHEEPWPLLAGTLGLAHGALRSRHAAFHVYLAGKLTLCSCS